MLFGFTSGLKGLKRNSTNNPNKREEAKASSFFVLSPASAIKDAGLTRQEEERGTRDRVTGG